MARQEVLLRLVLGILASLLLHVAPAMAQGEGRVTEVTAETDETSDPPPPDTSGGRIRLTPQGGRVQGDNTYSGLFGPEDPDDPYQGFFVNPGNIVPRVRTTSGFPQQFELLLGGGHGRTLQKKDELDGNSSYLTLQFTYRPPDWATVAEPVEGGRRVFISIAPHLRAEGSLFEDEKFEGDLWRVLGGFRLQMSDVPRERDRMRHNEWPIAMWSVDLAFMGGYGRQTGQRTDSDPYELDNNDSGYIALELTLKTSAFMIPSGNYDDEGNLRRYHRGSHMQDGSRVPTRVPLVSGFIHEVSVSGYMLYAFEVDKSSSALDQGFNDEWSDDTEYRLDLHIGIGRMYHRWGGLSSSDLELSGYVKFRGRWYYANGFEDPDLDGDDLTMDLGFGGGFKVELFHNFSLIGEGLYLQNMDTRESGLGTFFALNWIF